MKVGLVVSLSIRVMKFQCNYWEKQKVVGLPSPLIGTSACRSATAMVSVILNYLFCAIDVVRRAVVSDCSVKCVLCRLISFLK